VSVAGDHDLAAHVDAARLEHGVVGRHSVVHVHEVAGDVARGGVRAVRDHHVLAERVLVDRHARLGRGHQRLERLEHLELDRLRLGQVAVEDRDLHLEAERLELLRHELGRALRARRSRAARLFREQAQIAPQVRRLRQREEAILERHLARASRRSEPGRTGIDGRRR
jgi:hypothetical protein